MRPTTAAVTASQLSMAGMPLPASSQPSASSGNLLPGREVLYLGKVSGGPRYGSKGMVMRTLGRTAVVDMGRWGTWHIPYWFLSVPLAAG